MIVTIDLEQLAAAAFAEAQKHPHRSPERRAAAHAWSALITSPSVTAARKAITTFGDEQTQQAATELLNRLVAGLATIERTPAP